MRKTLIWTAAFILLFTFAASASHAKEDKLKIGYIDIVKVFGEYYKTKESRENLAKKAESKNKEREKIVADIKKLQDEAELLNKEERAKKESTIEEKLKNLKDFDRATQEELNREGDSVERDLLMEVLKGVEEYGKKNEFDMIVNDRALFYGAETLDVSSDIIKYINEKKQ